MKLSFFALKEQYRERGRIRRLEKFILWEALQFVHFIHGRDELRTQNFSQEIKDNIWETCAQTGEQH
jgi:hypothetical protein